MTHLPQSLQALAAALTQLPGIGPRSAERLALHIVQAHPDNVQQLADALVGARRAVGMCEICGALAETQPCALCCRADRDASTVCVVEQPVDVIRIERPGVYRGRYHVLGGRLSPVNGIEPEDLRIGALERRLKSEPIREVILALSTDVEGDATSYYLAKRLEAAGRRITRLAHGLPAGAGLEFADDLTLSKALSGRQTIHADASAS